VNAKQPPKSENIVVILNWTEELKHNVPVN
jgi:hypothetical protein